VHGIGILNVHRRIRMVYDAYSGLELDSEAGRGTKVALRMRRTKDYEGGKQ